MQWQNIIAIIFYLITPSKLAIGIIHSLTTCKMFVVQASVPRAQKCFSSPPFKTRLQPCYMGYMFDIILIRMVHRQVDKETV